MALRDINRHDVISLFITFRWANHASEAGRRPLGLHWQPRLPFAAVRPPSLCYGPESLGNFYAMYFLQGHAGLRVVLQLRWFPVFHHHFRLGNKDIAGPHVLFEPAVKQWF